MNDEGMLEFSLGSHLGWYPSSIQHHFQSSKSKISKIHVFGHQRYFRHRYKLPSMQIGLLRNLLMACQSCNCCPILMIFTPLESSVQSRLRMSHFQTSAKDFSAPKIIQFEIQILLGQSVTIAIHSWRTKNDGHFALVNFKFLSLEKIFQLSLVQTAKSYHIKTQQNLEFLGEFDGGAKTTSNSGVISQFEYREI